MLFLQNAGAKVQFFCEIQKLFCTFALVFSVFYMKRLKNTLGLMLMALGTVLLAVLHVLNLTFVNALLFLPLLLIMAGIIIHVYMQKRESRY